MGDPGPAAYRVDNVGLTANMAARFAGIKGDQLDSYFLQDESREEADWMRDFPKQRKDMEATRATLGLIVDGREIRLYRVYGARISCPLIRITWRRWRARTILSGRWKESRCWQSKRVCILRQ